MEINETQRMQNVIDEIIRLAENRGWTFISRNDPSNLVSFQKEFFIKTRSS